MGSTTETPLNWGLCRKEQWFLHRKTLYSVIKLGLIKTLKLLSRNGENGKTKTKPFWKSKTYYTVRNCVNERDIIMTQKRWRPCLDININSSSGMVFCTRKYNSVHCDQPSLQFVLLQNYRWQAMKACHDDIGHLGLERSLDLLKDRFSLGRNDCWDRKPYPNLQ